MQNYKGGKGILLGGIPGVPAAEVVILGAGEAGKAATRAFLVPGSNLFDASEIAVPPSRPSKRAIRLSDRLGPPAFSHGIHTLYESPSSLEL